MAKRKSNGTDILSMNYGSFLLVGDGAEWDEENVTPGQFACAIILNKGSIQTLQDDQGRDVLSKYCDFTEVMDDGRQCMIVARPGERFGLCETAGTGSSAVIIFDKPQ